MPKRTNQFQKIVTYNATQLAPLGATVRESVLLEEATAPGVLREVDTLIEVGAGITRVVVAVEARDRLRKDDIQWVDQIIGKYQRLPVDRVLAVSKSGFSAAAKKKAQEARINLLSPNDVLTTDRR